MSRGKKSDSAPKPAKPRLVNVAVMAAVPNALTYAIPEGMELLTGQRVQVPLGNRRATGIVIEPVAIAEPGVKIREVLRTLDPEPVLSPELVTLGRGSVPRHASPAPGDSPRADGTAHRRRQAAA